MISIIIVHYKSDNLVVSLITSIQKQKSKAAYEIIVVDNDEEKNPDFEKEVKKFTHVIYLANEKNSGYSGGNNLGAKHAKGEYLFFLNPDTQFVSPVLDELVAFEKDHEDSGAVAPLLLDKNETVYPLQGTKILGVVNGLVAFSFLNKLFPHNPISKSYWNLGWDKTKEKEVDVVPGTAFLIKKHLFEEMGGFDEQYFLFFEEFDFCRKLRRKGYKNYILPSAKLVHYWGESTKQRSDIQKIFTNSRYYYYKKYYGKFLALLVTGLLGISFEFLSIAGIIFLGAFLRLYHMDTLMTFIGDFAWFYLSAKDMLISHHIPLVGIVSSHTWLHQGPLWTYILSVALVLGKFHPASGGYLAAGIGIVTLVFLYFFTKDMFGKITALFASLFFATSPLVVVFSRMPYHTAPIPLFVLLYIYSLYKWIKGSPNFFALCLLFLTTLYNFELATSVLVAPFIFFFLYGLWKKKTYVTKLKKLKPILFSFGGFILPMIPMIIYDTSHKFPQTFGYVAWIGYRLLLLFGYPPIHGSESSGTIGDMLSFLFTYQQQFFYFPNGIIAMSICLPGIFFLCKKYQHTASQIILLTLLIPLLAVFVGKVPSQAYLPMFFVQLAIIFGIFSQELFKGSFWQKRIVVGLITLICLVNSVTMVGRNFFVGQYEVYGPSYTEKVHASYKIARAANCSDYTLRASPENRQYKTILMPYDYILWWLKQPPKSHATIKIIVDETKDGISIQKQ